MVNAMLISSGLSENLWEEDLLSSCFILNRIPSKASDKTPYKLWKGRTPNLGFLKVWGCLTKVNIPEPKKKKLGSKIMDTIFIGYAQNSNAYRFLVIKSEISDIANNTILESRNTSFFENIFPFKTKIPSEVSVPSSSRSVDPEPELEPESEPELRRSKWKRIDKNFGEDFFTYFIEGDPCTYDEAMSSLDSLY